MKEYEWNGGVAPHVLFLDPIGRVNVLLHSPAALILRKKSQSSNEGERFFGKEVRALQTRNLVIGLRID